MMDYERTAPFFRHKKPGFTPGLLQGAKLM
jgi:hypothetical protein